MSRRGMPQYTMSLKWTVEATPQRLDVVPSPPLKSTVEVSSATRKLARPTSVDRHSSDFGGTPSGRLRGAGQLMHSLRGMVKTYGVRLPHSTSDQFLQRCKSSVPAELLPQLEGIFTIIQSLTEQIESYDELIEKIAAEQYPAVQILKKVPGVGTLTASTYVTTIADPGRFAKSRAVGAFLGLRPRQQQSGGQNPQLGITKAGDVYLRKLLVQSAHCVLSSRGQDTALKQWGLKLCQRGGSNAKKRAVVAVARKLAVLLHKLWVSGELYRPFPAR